MNLEFALQPYGDVEKDISLKKRTTFRIGGNAKYFIYPKNYICLMRIIDILNENHIDRKIFGKGSNLLCSDQDYDGVIICLDRYFSDYHFEEDGTCLVQAGCSIILLAHEAMKHSLSGLEFASGIPGTVGGALFMNAGAYQSDMSNIVKEVYVYRNRKVETLYVDTLDYAYRHSIFQKHPDWIILGARLQLTKGNQIEIKNLMDARRKRRMDSQPLDMPCAGSIFRNPSEHAAWKLIDEQGFRGKSIGGAMVSQKHSNFIVNYDNALAQDVVDLIENIQNAVKDETGIELICEVERFNWK